MSKTTNKKNTAPQSDGERSDEVKLKELGALIQEGIDSGSGTPLDVEEIKATARRQLE